jgi:hypothetical protein
VRTRRPGAGAASGPYTPYPMAIFQSDARTLLKRLAEKSFGSTQERDQLLAQLAQVEGLQARDVTWMLFRPDRAYRDAVVGVLKRCADPETATVIVGECKGKPEAAVRAAAATLFSLAIPGTEQRLAALATQGSPEARETARRLLLDAPVTPALAPVLWQLARGGPSQDRLAFLARLATGTLDAQGLARWQQLARDHDKAVREKALTAGSRPSATTTSWIWSRRSPRAFAVWPTPTPARSPTACTPSPGP